MPKKTKRQKMQADNRHVAPPVFQFQAAPLFAQKTHQLEDESELKAIRMDIVKTLVLSVIAIGVEFALYFRFFV